MEQSINDYLQEIAELRLPVRVVIDNNLEITDGRILYKIGQKSGLFIKVKNGDYPVSGNITVTGNYANALYKFSSSIIGVTRIDSAHHYLQISIPEKITKEERRKSFRVQPSEQKPVSVSFTMPDSRIITVEAIDISGGGLAIVLPSDIAAFQIGQCLSLNISLPGFEKIETNADIKGVFRLLNMIRIGMAFLEIPEAAHRMLMQYIIYREAETIEEGRHKASAQKARVCLIEESKKYDKYVFLERLCTLVKIDFFNTIPRLAIHPPELIVINADVPEALTLLSLIRSNQRLKFIPFLLLSSRELDVEIPPDSTILSSPFDEALFVKTMIYLIDKYRQLKKLQEKNMEIIAGRGHKIFIIDRFHKFGSKNTEFLISNGFEVITDDSEENIPARIVKVHPDVIILDEETEKTDPVSLCRLLNMNYVVKRIPKIILTSAEANFERFYSQGFFAGYLVKPVSTDQLLAKLFELIPADWG